MIWDTYDIPDVGSRIRIFPVLVPGPRVQKTRIRNTAV
jgi:hypothetical protein